MDAERPETTPVAAAKVEAVISSLRPLTYDNTAMLLVDAIRR
jgi:hypothetical protein